MNKYESLNADHTPSKLYPGRTLHEEGEINHAKDLLTRLLASGENSGRTIDSIIDSLGDGRGTPEDIGTTREELLALQKRMNMDEGREMLNEARKNPQEIYRLREHLEETGISPQHIGTSEEELERIQQEAEK